MSFWTGTHWERGDPAPPPKTGQSRRRHIAEAVAEGTLIGLLAVGLVAGSAFAAKGGHSGSAGGKHAGSGCTVNPPLVKVDNTYGWAKWGSWGLPGQQLTYAVNVVNYDVGCRASTFTLSLAAPSGFSVSLPSTTMKLKSGASAYVFATVKSPSGIGDGDYALTATATRSGKSDNSASFTTYYKAYSSDTVAPNLFYPNPGDGTTISGSSYNFVVSSTDDHAVKTIQLYIDGTLSGTTTCSDISYTCSLHSNQSISPGQHTATFRASDWLGNVGSLTVNYTVD